MGSWAYFDPEYETLSIRINPPQVSVDNSSCMECTLVKVDSMNKPGILLEVVQILTDLDLIITKAYISSDGGWFMDVFHVTDQNGQKINNSKTIEYIEKALGPKGNMYGLLKPSPGKKVGVGLDSMGDCTAIELIGPDRPGLLSEISAVLANLQINVAAAEVWTHNGRIACVLYVNDDTTNRAVDDASWLAAMEEQVKNILRGDYEVTGTEPDSPVKPNVTIERCEEKDYSVVTVKCKDRPKLMFDIVCTLTDMQYVVFHATISSDGPYASQEYFIRQMDGCTLQTEGEKEKAIKCLEAAIRRRTSEGISLELCAKDRVGLLSEVTRILRENGLSVTRAGVTTVGEQAVNVFYVSDASGKPVDARTIEALRKETGKTMRLNVKKPPMNTKALEASGWAKTSFFFGGLLEKLLH
ncbi:Arsenical-resistance protein 3 [Salvia divinorum]|uniref:ACT domain-containing protein ACR n=1 Tax=Salvia divinorum TaxID=28513 RepID=A0ABD1FR94_SALDI